MRYELWLFSLATVAELNTVSEPVLVHVTHSNYQPKRHSVNQGQVPILVKAKSMASPPCFELGDKRKKLSKIQRAIRQPDHDVKEQYLLCLKEGKLLYGQCDSVPIMEITWEKMVGDENSRWHIEVDKDNSHDNQLPFQAIKRNQVSCVFFFIFLPVLKILSA